MLAILAILAAFPTYEPPTDRVALIEVNHLYDARGQHVIDQVIFWDWDRDRFQVRAWRLIKSDVQLPKRNRCGDYECYWCDGNTLRKVIAHQKRETWTTYDPEVLEREMLPIEFRRELVQWR